MGINHCVRRGHPNPRAAYPQRRRAHPESEKGRAAASACSAQERESTREGEDRNARTVWRERAGGDQCGPRTPAHALVHTCDAHRRTYASRPPRSGSTSAPRPAAKPRVKWEATAPVRLPARLGSSAAGATAAVPVPVAGPGVVAPSQRTIWRISGRSRSSSAGQAQSSTAVEPDSTTVATYSTQESAIAEPSRKALGKRKAPVLGDIAKEREPEDDSLRAAKRTRTGMQPDAELLLDFAAQSLPFDHLVDVVRRELRDLQG